MNNTCLNIQEQIPELLADALPTEQTAELHEHISTCADCRRYLEALQADDNLLGEFIESMQPTLARLEKNVIDSLGRGRQNIKAHTIPIWRTIMKSRIIKIAVAAMIIISTAIVVQHFGVAFRTTTITYGMTNLPDLLNDTQTLHVQSTP